MLLELTHTYISNSTTRILPSGPCGVAATEPLQAPAPCALNHKTHATTTTKHSSNNNTIKLNTTTTTNNNNNNYTYT